ncbi:MAG TPA: hypothetical protein VI231_21695 [Candidatus Binatia bacterium]|jgi:hypothetical protein
MFKFSLAVLIPLALAACASFKPEWKYQDLINAHRPQATDAHNGLEISVENTSAEKAQKIFDSNLRSNGVLPVFVKASNKSATVYRIAANSATATAGAGSLSVLRGVDAAVIAGDRDVAGKAALWTLAGGPLFWATGLTVSGFHSSKINNDIEHHFENLEFGDSTLQPDQVIGGFIYFKVPENVKELQNLTIEIPATDEKTGTRTVFKFSIKS